MVIGRALFWDWSGRIGIYVCFWELYEYQGQYNDCYHDLDYDSLIASFSEQLELAF